MDPTTKLKNRLINILKSMKTESEMDDNTYKRMYPIGPVHQSLWAPQVT